MGDWDSWEGLVSAAEIVAMELEEEEEKEELRKRSNETQQETITFKPINGKSSISMEPPSLSHSTLDHSNKKGLMIKDESCNRPVSKSLNISEKSERLMKEKFLKKHVTFTYPEDMSREEILRRERLLKRPIVEETPPPVKRTRFECGDNDQDYMPRIKKKKKGKNNSTKLFNKNKYVKEKITYHGPNPPPPFPIEFREFINREFGGWDEEPKLVIQKGLTRTDLLDGQNRISVPLKDVREKFLEEYEIEELNKRIDDKHLRFIDVKFICPSVNLWEISLRKWDMKKANGSVSSSYILNGSWNLIKRHNRLRPRMVVQLWAFRVEGKLHFALVRLPNRSGNGDQSGTNHAASSSSEPTKE